MTQITTEAQLRELYEMPVSLVVSKDIHHIDKHAQHFIESSRLFFLASQSKDGFYDVSPRGGEKGFVKVLDDQHITFADSPGNNRLDTLTNLLSNPNMGMLFIVPGIQDIVRLKGIASLHRDDELLNLCQDGKHKPKLVIKIKVTSLLFHCPKALIMSKIWNSETHIDRHFLPGLLSIIQEQQIEKQQRMARDRSLATS